MKESWILGGNVWRYHQKSTKKTPGDILFWISGERNCQIGISPPCAWFFTPNKQSKSHHRYLQSRGYGFIRLAVGRSVGKHEPQIKSRWAWSSLAARVSRRYPSKNSNALVIAGTEIHCRPASVTKRWNVGSLSEYYTIWANPQGI